LDLSDLSAHSNNNSPLTLLAQQHPSQHHNNNAHIHANGLHGGAANGVHVRFPINNISNSNSSGTGAGMSSHASMAAATAEAAAAGRGGHTLDDGHSHMRGYANSLSLPAPMSPSVVAQNAPNSSGSDSSGDNHITTASTTMVATAAAAGSHGNATSGHGRGHAHTHGDRSHSHGPIRGATSGSGGGGVGRPWSPSLESQSQISQAAAARYSQSIAVVHDRPPHHLYSSSPAVTRPLPSSTIDGGSFHALDAMARAQSPSGGSGAGSAHRNNNNNNNSSELTPERIAIISVPPLNINNDTVTSIHVTSAPLAAANVGATSDMLSTHHHHNMVTPITLPPLSSATSHHSVTLPPIIISPPSQLSFSASPPLPLPYSSNVRPLMSLSPNTFSSISIATLPPSGSGNNNMIPSSSLPSMSTSIRAPTPLVSSSPNELRVSPTVLTPPARGRTIIAALSSGMSPPFSSIGSGSGGSVLAGGVSSAALTSSSPSPSPNAPTQSTAWPLINNNPSTSPPLVTVTHTSATGVVSAVSGNATSGGGKKTTTSPRTAAITTPNVLTNDTSPKGGGLPVVSRGSGGGGNDVEPRVGCLTRVYRLFFCLCKCNRCQCCRRGTAVVPMTISQSAPAGVGANALHQQQQQQQQQPKSGKIKGVRIGEDTDDNKMVTNVSTMTITSPTTATTTTLNIASPSAATAAHHSLQVRQ
jgi:hypothetical protein